MKTGLEPRCTAIFVNTFHLRGSRYDFSSTRVQIQSNLAKRQNQMHYPINKEKSIKDDMPSQSNSRNLDIPFSKLSIYFCRV